jgi:hypothetical protein
VTQFGWPIGPGWVDSGKSSVVRPRYRLPTEIDPAGSDWPDASTTRQVDVSTTTTYPAG